MKDDRVAGLKRDIFYLRYNQGSGFGDQGLGFRVKGLGFRVYGLGFGVQGKEGVLCSDIGRATTNHFKSFAAVICIMLRVRGLGFRVWSLGLRA